MHKALVIAFTFAVSALASGCMSVASPVIGLGYTDVQYGTDAEGAIGSKEGRACARTILGMYATGDASIATAAKNGNIKTVTVVDHHAKNLAGVIGDYCTIVRGN
jgi:hypothetical protein